MSLKSIIKNAKETNQDSFADVSEEQQEQEEDSYTMFTTRDSSTEPIVITCLLNDVPTDMEFASFASFLIK